MAWAAMRRAKSRARWRSTLTLQYAQQGSRWYVDIGEREAREIVARVESILASVDRAIAAQAERDSALAGMGTTLTVGVVRADRLFVYHVGDSRAYLLRQGHLVRITRDQTVAQQLADSGLISDALVGSHHTRHLLTQAVGRGDVEVEVHHFPLQHGDRLVLSTDGLTDGVEDSEIERVCSEGDCEQACQQLLERGACRRGTGQHHRGRRRRRHRALTRASSVHFRARRAPPRGRRPSAPRRVPTAQRPPSAERVARGRPLAAVRPRALW